LSRMLKRLDGITAGGFTKKVLTAGKETFEEALQEAFQSGMGDIIAKEVYDPNRKLFKDLKEDAAVGGVTGFLFSLVTQSIGGRRGASVDGKGPEPEVDPTAPVRKEEPVSAVRLYETPRQTQEEIKALLAREMAGEQSVELQTALAKVYAEPDNHAFYTLEKAKLRREADSKKAQPPVATAPDALPQVITEVPEPDETDLDYDGGEMPNYADPAGVAAPVVDPRLKAVRQAAVGYTAEEAAPSLEAIAERVAEGAEGRGGRLTSQEIRVLASLTPQQRQQYMALVEAKRKVVAPSVPSNVPTPVANVPTPPVDPSTQVTEVEVEEDGTMPDIEETTPAAPPVVAPAVNEVRREALQRQVEFFEKQAAELKTAVESGKSDSKALRRLDWLTRRMTDLRERMAQPATSVQFDVRDIDTESTDADIGTARGRRTFPGYFELGDGTEASKVLETLGTKFSPELGEVLTSQSSPNQMFSKNFSHRLTAFEGPGGEVQVRGTFKRANDFWIAQPGGAGAVPLSEFMGQGWKPIASIRVAYPLKDATFSYQSKAEYVRELADAPGMVRALKATGAAVESQLKSAELKGKSGEFEETEPEAEGETEVEDAPVVEVASAPAPVLRGFTAEHAGVIFDAVSNLPVQDIETGFVAAIAARRAAARAVAEGVKLIAATSESAEEAFGTFQEIIYEAYRSSAKNKTAFINGVQAALAQQGLGHHLESRRSEPSGPAASATGNAVAAAAAEVESPTDKEKQSGNYKKGHVEIDGLEITIETPKGAHRTGTDATGKSWQVEMPAHYGYVKGTEGKDGDQVDVYIGPNPEASMVYVVDQINPQTKKFDEHKAMLGFNSRAEAIATYVAGFSDGSGASRLGEMTQMTKQDFVDWVNEGDTSAPLAYGKKFKATMMRYRGPQDAPFHASREALNRMWMAALDGAQAQGLDIQVIKRLVGEMVAVGGEWRPGQVILSVADALNPTADNLVLLFHEVGHEVWSKLSPEMQGKLNGAVRAALDGKFKMEGFTPKIDESVTDPAEREATEMEERVVESVARELTKQGFNADEARGWGHKLWRALANVWHRALMALQSSRFGNGVSPKLAQSYMVNRVKQFIAGDQQPMSYTSWMGGPKYRQVGFVQDPTTAPSADLNESALKGQEVAAQNAIEAALRNVWAEWTSYGHNTMGMTFEEFVESGNFVKLDELPADVVARVNDGLQNAGLPPVDPKTDIGGLSTKSFQQRAAAVAWKALNQVYTENLKRRKEAEWAMSARNKGNLPDRLSRANLRLVNLQAQYTNADFLLADARQQVARLFTDFREDTKDIKSIARKAGTLTQVIRNIEGKIDRPLLRQYESAINRLYARMSGDQANLFLETLQRSAELPGVDWENDTAGVIRGKLLNAAIFGDPALAPLIDPSLDTKALMAVVVAFGKSNGHVMDLLQLRRSDAIAERTIVNQALKQAMDDSRDAISQARSLVNKLPRLAVTAERLLTRLEKLKADNQEMMDEMQRYRTFIDFHHDTNPVLRVEQARLEKLLGAINEEWEPVDGAKYFVPSNVNATVDQVEKSVKELRFNGTTTSADVRADMAKMKAWLDAVPADQRGAVWGTVNRQYNELARSDLDFSHYAIQNAWLAKFIGPLTDRLKFIGTPAARAAAKRLETMSFWLASKQHTAHELGVKWDVAFQEAMKTTGLDRRDTFKTLFYNPMLSFLEKRQDLMPNVDAVLTELRKYWTSDPDMRDMVARPGAWPALEKLVRLTAKNSSWADGNRSEMGIKIKDDGLYRESIGLAPFHVIRGWNEKVQAMYDGMKETWLEPLKAEDVAQAYAQDPAALRQALAPRFTREIWEQFVEPLANRTGRSVFYAPPTTGGLQKFALRERVLKAFDVSRGDPVTFAEALYQLEGGTSDMGEFVAETLDTFQSFFNILHDTHKEEEHANQTGAMIPKRYLMDARRSEEAPAEWLDYFEYGVHGLRQLTKLQSNEKAFGRDMGGMRQDFRDAIEEQRGFERRHRELQQMFPTLTGKKLKEAVRVEAKRQGINPMVLEQAHKNIDGLERAQGRWEALLRIGSERPLEVRAFAEILSAMTAATVQGPGTALLDTISMIEQPFRKLGLGADAFRMVKDGVKGSMTTGLGSLMQALGKQMNIDADHTRLMFELGHFDTDATVAAKDKFKALLAEPVATDNRVLKGLTTASRAVRAAMGTGIGKAQGDTAFPTVKPHALFTQAAQTVHAGQVLAWWKTFEKLTGKAVKYFQSNPGDMADPAFEFTPKDLGYTDGFFGGLRSWEYLNASLKRYGVSLEQEAREAVERRKVDPGSMLLRKDTYRAIAQHGINEVTLDSAVTTRPPEFLTSGFWSLVNPLVGWSISKGYDVAKSIRSPDGRFTPQAFRTGLLAYLAILPIGIAYALMRDWYDEEIVGKKQNVLSVTTADTPQEAFVATMDSLARVGTGGFFGEAVNGMFNMDTTRELSVDSRVFFLSALKNTYNSLSTWYKQGEADWPTVFRPMAQALGGSGYLQYADILNNATSADNAESRVVRRINVNNYLRTVGRELNLDVRTGRGMQALPNPIKPHIGQMVLAAYANDPVGFRDAYREAVQAAREERKPDPKDHVARSFSAYHPLRMVFRTEPSEAEYRKILGTLDDDGRMAVASAVRLFNGYAAQVGGTATVGRQPKKQTLVPQLVKRLSLDDVRRRAAGIGAL
jgi:hypothetical protein